MSRSPSADWAVRSVPIKAIAILPGRRPVNRKWLPDLARSIAVDGLRVPIIVRAVGGGKRPYELVAGLHRLKACSRLGWAEIDATVTDLDDATAEMATVTENLYCNPLKKLEFERALARWEAHYQARYPETIQYRAGGVAKARKGRSVTAGKTAGPTNEGGDGNAGGPGGGASSFSQVVAVRLGVSKRTAERHLKRNRLFSAEDYQTFEQCGVTATQQDAIATIADPDRRSQCLWDIAQGLDPEKAVARYKSSFDRGAGVSTGGGVDEAKMGDPEWLEANCGAIRRRLKTPKVYEADALFYRKMDELRREFKAKGQDALDRIGVEQRGLFAQLIWRLFHLTHPGDWRVCDACDGAGIGPEGSGCRKCFYPGSGYLLGYEKGR